MKPPWILKRILILTAGFGEGEDVAAWNVREALEHLAMTPLEPVALPLPPPPAQPHPLPSPPKPRLSKDPGTVCAHEGDPLCTQLP